jgi:O-antigen/teichoic acid export membrane protein
MTDPLSSRVLMRNAAANLAIGAAGAILAVVLPPFLVRLLDRDSYSIWSLLLQIGAYASLLSFGLQTAVGHFVAQAKVRQDIDQADRIVSTAFAILSASALTALLAMGSLAALLPHLFPDIPRTLQTDARAALLCVGGSLALGLPFTVMNGVFVGLQRNEIPALIIVLGRLGTGIGLVATAASRHGLIAMAMVFATLNLLTYFAQALALRIYAPQFHLSRRHIASQSFGKLVSYCATISTWSFGMFLVSGLDLTLVARFDFPAVGAFAIASGLLALLQGAQSAILNAYLPVGASLDAQGNRERIRALLLSTTRWNLLASGFAMGAYAFFGRTLIHAYVGSQYATQVVPLLSVLLVGGSIRFSMVPYNVFVLGAGDHRRIILGPIAEGIANLIASVLLVWKLGAIGVAWGTLLGGIVGVAFHLALNVPRSLKLGTRLRDFLGLAFIPATLAILPWMLLLTLDGFAVRFSMAQTWTIRLTAFVAFSLIGWGLAVLPAEKTYLTSKVKSAL